MTGKLCYLDYFLIQDNIEKGSAYSKTVYSYRFHSQHIVVYVIYALHSL